MKTYLIILSGLLLSLATSSCQKFVDIKKTSSQFFMTTAKDCELMLDDYTIMNTNYPIDGEISADDYFISNATYQLASIPQEEKDLYTWNASAQRTSPIPNWQNPYKVISNANLVLETLEKLKGSNEDPVQLNTLRGSALFYRAYCFWNVAQLYAAPYSSATANQDPGIPLRLSSDINDKSDRGTVENTYNQILQDLSEAVNLLPNTSTYATRPSKVAAYAMLARTYLSMSDYQNALVNANAALAIKKDLLNYNNISTFSGTPFSRFNAEVIFHTIAYNKSSAPIAGPIISPGFETSNTAKINTGLVNSYAANDLRSQIFLKANSITVTLDDPSSPSGKKPVTLRDGTYRFTGNYEPAFFGTLFNGLAVDEVFLIRAECYARTGNVSAAVTDLNTLLSNRWKTGFYIDISTQISPETALTIVLDERRKELLMRGLRWTDLRRLKKSAIRETRNITFTGTVTNPVKVDNVVMTNTITANDLRYTLLLPKQLLDNSGLVQNAR